MPGLVDTGGDISIKVVAFPLLPPPQPTYPPPKHYLPCHRPLRRSQCHGQLCKERELLSAADSRAGDEVASLSGAEAEAWVAAEGC